VSRDCSYFMMHAGRDGMQVLVWPATHYDVAWVDWAKVTDRIFANGSDVAMSKRAIDRVVSRLWSERKPMKLVVPPYGVFLCRGDVLHAGAEHNGPDPNVRCHTHLTVPKDKTLNAVEMRPFGL
jgi:cell wall-associated NlpC family hydrolase